jgi:3-oxo-5-alpha-steroid 4-dehydrogenase 3
MRSEFVYEAFYHDLSLILNKLWVLMIIGAVLVLIIPALHPIALHGKNYQEKPSENNELSFSSSVLLVPKRFFIHFYIVSCCLQLCFICKDLFFLSHPIIYLTKCLFFLHSFRRFCECYSITSYGNSMMHIGGYIAGIVHYVAAVLTLEVASFESHHLRDHSFSLPFSEKSMQSNRSTLGVFILVSLFCIMNYLQYQSHFILWKSKNKQMKEETKISSSSSTSSIRYSIPNEGLFLYCCCPHYFTEIMIYLSLFILESQCLTILLMFIWVLTNLSIVAYQQYQWYLENDFDNLTSRRRWIVFPFLW